MKKLNKALCATVLTAGMLFSALPEAAVTAKAAEPSEMTEIIFADKAADDEEVISADKEGFGPFINDMLAVTQERVEGKRIIEWNYDTVKAYGKSLVPNAQDDSATYTSADGRYEYYGSISSNGNKAAELTIDEDLYINGRYFAETQTNMGLVECLPLQVAAKYQSLSTMGTINNTNPATYIDSLFASNTNDKIIVFSDGTKMRVQRFYADEYAITYTSASESSGVAVLYEDGVLVSVMTVTTPSEAFPAGVATGTTDTAGGETPSEPIVVPGQVSMYRLYNPNSGEHFYTKDSGERDFLLAGGWSYESVAWISPETSNTPVYRLYNKNSGEHHYTTSVGERDGLVAMGWSDEGIGWYASDNQATPMYRLYNPNAKGAQEAGSHHYTNNVSERDFLISQGWNDEGIGWYGL